ncbi:hypothetical protein AGOR_G00239850 [Albula goreensis]|uniref:RAB6-interacting golgin n=1 Tax=Albula goreensis TaxID=1534307 RepID=A0A8T3CD42_9TELE|nr:hypothetical protein AGOR_G00239850 [Albula goreensis]
MMEEKNKRKKALLSKTLAEKSKRTQAEAVKLKRIQAELHALDNMVSNDIGILRGRIEQASWDYSTARKRYDKAEVEFVAAKLDLHKKAGLKEQLTEHLCSIIQQNELRKARKLEELMQRLDLQPDEESLELEIQVEHMLREQEEAEQKQEAGRAIEVGKGVGPDAVEGGCHGAEGELGESPHPDLEPKRNEQCSDVMDSVPPSEPLANETPASDA